MLGIQFFSLTCRYTYFVAGQKLDNSQCVLFAHRKPNAPAGSEEPPPGRLVYYNMIGYLHSLPHDIPAPIYS